MFRRRFLQMIAGAALAAFMRPFGGFGLGQTQLQEAAPDASFREWVTDIHRQLSRHGWVQFPQATGSWGTVSAAGLFRPGDKEPSLIIPLDCSWRQVRTGDSVRVDFESYETPFIEGDGSVEVGLLGPDDLEASGGGYQRARIIVQQEAPDA